jgi:hypothetical protein
MANFGDISTNIILSGGESVRRNLADVNFETYIPAADVSLGDYVQKSGDTMTGDLTIDASIYINGNMFIEVGGVAGAFTGPKYLGFGDKSVDQYTSYFGEITTGNVKIYGQNTLNINIDGFDIATFQHVASRSLLIDSIYASSGMYINEKTLINDGVIYPNYSQSTTTYISVGDVNNELEINTASTLRFKVGDVGITLQYGVSVNNIETTLTNNDDRLPTSGAVSDALNLYETKTNLDASLSLYSPFDASIGFKEAAYTVIQDDNNHVIEASGTFTVTFPNNVTQGFQITIVNSGIGTITLDASNLLTTDTFVNLIKQYAGASAVHKGNGSWYAWAPEDISIIAAKADVDASFGTVWTKFGYVDTSLNNIEGSGISQDYVDGSIVAAVDAVDSSLVTYVDNKITNVDTSFGLYETKVNLDSSFGTVYTYVDGSLNLKLDNTTDTFTGVLTIDGSLVLYGDLFQDGSSYIIHATNLDVSNNFITLRYGAVTALADGSISGIRITKPDGINDVIFGAGNDAIMRVGWEPSTLQALATREDNPTDNEYAYWDDSSTMFKTRDLKGDLDSSFGLYETKVNLDSSFGSISIDDLDDVSIGTTIADENILQYKVDTSTWDNTPVEDTTDYFSLKTDVDTSLNAIDVKLDNVDSSFNLYETKVNLDSSFGLYLNLTSDNSISGITEFDSSIIIKTSNASTYWLDVDITGALVANIIS